MPIILFTTKETLTELFHTEEPSNAIPDLTGVSRAKETKVRRPDFTNEDVTLSYDIIIVMHLRDSSNSSDALPAETSVLQAYSNCLTGLTSKSALD